MQKWELQSALHSFLSEKTLPSARNAMNNIIKVEFETAFAAMLSVPTEKQGECILTLILSPACKMSLYKIGIFWIIIATASVRIIAIVLSYAVC